MPRYNIGGKWITSSKPLSDDEIDEIAGDLGGVPAPPKAPSITPPPSKPEGFMSGVGERVGEYAKGIGDLIGTAGTDLKTGRPIGATAMATIGEGLWEGAKNYGQEFQRRSQSAMDQLNLLKAKNEEKIARGETPGLVDTLTSPEFGEAMAQSAHATGVPEVETEEVIPGSGGALVPTRKALGRLATDTVAANPPIKTAMAAASKVGGALPTVPGPTDLAAGLRAAHGLEEGAAAKRAFDIAPPPSKVLVDPGFQGPPKRLNLPEQGRIVGETELMNLNMRKKFFGEAFKKLDELLPEGVDLSPMLDETGNLRVPPGTELPPELQTLTKQIRQEAQRMEKARAAANPGEIVTSDKLDALVAQLRQTPFSQVHRMRSSIGQAIRAVKLRGSAASDIVPLKQAVEELDKVMDDAALVNPSALESYAAARKVWKDEVVGPHYDGAGADISKMMEGHAPTPERMGEIIPTFGADTVMSARRALVPGDWAPEAARRAGQKAFDHLVEQTVRTKLGAKNVEDVIDLASAFDDIQTKIGDAAWQQMISGSSPEQATRLINMEKAARAYKQIAPVQPTARETVAATTMGAAAGALPGTPLGPAAGAYAGNRLTRAAANLKASILRWALEHPARTEILTQGMANTTSSVEAAALAARNIAAVTRLYELDKGRPPAREAFAIP